MAGKKKLFIVFTAVILLVVSIPLLALWGSRNDHRPEPYSGQWLNEETARWVSTLIYSDRVVVTEVYSNCFFGESLCFDRIIKLNGTLPDQLGAGDLVWVKIQNLHAERNSPKYEGDLLYVGTLPESWDMWYYFIRVIFR